MEATSRAAARHQEAVIKYEEAKGWQNAYLFGAVLCTAIAALGLIAAVKFRGSFDTITNPTKIAFGALMGMAFIGTTTCCYKGLSTRVPPEPTRRTWQRG